MKIYSVRTAFLFFLLCVSYTQLKAQKVGFLLDSYVTDRWYLDKKLFSDKIKDLGGECVVEVAFGNADTQLSLAKKLIKDGVKVLVVVPVDGRKAIEIVNLARQAHIPVIAYDRLIMSNDINIYISYNNEKVGELQAQYALSKVPQGNYMLLNGPVTDHNAILFRKGQLSVLQPGITSGKIKLVADYILEDWGEVGALMRVDEFFSTSSVLPEVIIAANDNIASGAIQALPDTYKGKITITGQDADISAIKYILNNNQSMTIYKPIKALAELSAEIAVKLAKGQEIKNKTKMTYDGITVNSILLEPITVDKGNYRETVVKDGHVSLSQLIDKK